MKTLKIAFDPTRPNINHSQYPVVTYAWVDGIRKSFPHVWNLGSSELSDDAFGLWGEFVKGRNDESTQKWIRRRENYAAKHYNGANSLLTEKITPRNAYALVNLLKWGISPSFGLRKTQELISDLIECEWSSTAIRFEKMFNDYPESAVDNAARALANRDTQEGKRGVSELAWSLAEKISRREKLTFTQIKKVAAFIKYKELARADYETSPAALTWLAVGGTNGVMWAKRRADSVDEGVQVPLIKTSVAEECSNEICGSCMMNKSGWCEQHDMPTVKNYVCKDWVDNEETSVDSDGPLMGVNSSVRKKSHKRYLKAVSLNRASLAKARRLISDGSESNDVHSRSEYIEKNGWDEFSKWYLASNKSHGTRNYARYIYPITEDFSAISLDALKKSKVQAAINGHKDVFSHCGKLIKEVEGKKQESTKTVTVPQQKNAAILTKAKPSFDVIKDDNGGVADYQNVRIAGYASTNENTTQADRGGDYLHRGAFKKTIPKFMQNPVMLADHRNSIKEIVGKYTSLKEDNSGLFIEGELSNSPEARHMRFQVAEGNLKTMSIGGLFHYDDDGKGINEVDLMEISLVAIPMNPDAVFEVRSFDPDHAGEEIKTENKTA